jgi:uncharacterized membrane protein YfcA
MSLESILLLIAGALVAGFVSGYAGFGTGMTASGFWLLALPASAVPPLIVLTGIVGQIMGVHRLRHSFDWSRARPYLIGAVCTVGIGVFALGQASALMTKITIGLLLVAFGTVQLTSLRHFSIKRWGGKIADTAVGAGAGFTAGFAGLPAPIPLIWLRLRGGSSAEQRMIYQPLNFVLVSSAGLIMLITGHLTQTVLIATAICVPATFIGAWFGLRAYSASSEQKFKRIVTALLFMSGVVLIVQAVREF